MYGCRSLNKISHSARNRWFDLWSNRASSFMAYFSFFQTIFTLDVAPSPITDSSLYSSKSKNVSSLGFSLRDERKFWYALFSSLSWFISFSDISLILSFSLSISFRRNAFSSFDFWISICSDAFYFSIILFYSSICCIFSVITFFSSSFLFSSWSNAIFSFHFLIS